MVLSYAWAAALQQAVVCIGRLLVQGMLTPLGTSTVTGYNMSLRTEQFLFCFSQGISAAMVVCLSQNLGHGDKARARRFYRVSVCAELALIAVLATVCFLLPERIVGIFSHNPQVIAAGAKYTGTMAYLYVFAYLGEVIQGFFRGLGQLRLTMVASLLQVLLRVVLSYLLIPVWGIYGICAAVAAGWVLLVAIEGTYSIRKARALTQV
jgi:Na+-driven multidrug efflux pump